MREEPGSVREDPSTPALAGEVAVAAASRGTVSEVAAAAASGGTVSEVAAAAASEGGVSEVGIVEWERWTNVEESAAALTAVEGAAIGGACVAMRQVSGFREICTVPCNCAGAATDSFSFLGNALDG